LRKPGSRETNLTKTVTDLRLLQIAPRVPWPLDTGAKLRNYHLARTGGMSATLSAFGDDASNDRLNEVYRRIVTVPRNENYSVGNILRGAFGGTPLPLLNYTTSEMVAALELLLAEDHFDLVQVESVHLMNYLPVLRSARNHPLVVCDWHNVESDLLLQYAEHERSVARRGYARRTARLMSKAEVRALNEFDAHIAVSEVDAKRLRSINSTARIFVIENGVDAEHYAGAASTTKNRIVFVASMDYHANIEGATSFVRNVWPMIQQEHTDLRFTIVGRNPPPAVTELSSIAGVEVTGSVADVRPYYREALAAVVPLKVGGGSRLKILEAMAAGVPLISTTLGAEGLQVTDGENILIADSPFELTNGIFKVINGAELRARLIAGGHALVRERYDWSTLGAKLLEQYQALVAHRNATDGVKSR
jgi:glycosyltransferase involved in cell wall biosynthesis